MNFKTLVAPVAALTLLIGGMVSTPEVKAETMWRDSFNHTTPSAVAPLTTTATTHVSTMTTSDLLSFTKTRFKTATATATDATGSAIAHDFEPKQANDQKLTNR